MSLDPKKITISDLHLNKKDRVLAEFIHEISSDAIIEFIDWFDNYQRQKGVSLVNGVLCDLRTVKPSSTYHGFDSYSSMQEYEDLKRGANRIRDAYMSYLGRHPEFIKLDAYQLYSFKWNSFINHINHVSTRFNVKIL